jgi:hypothetical protein
VLINNDFDPMAFVLLGTQFSESDPDGSEGYDGQFAYQIALNPTGAAPYIDVPAYRYQRIFYPMLARLLAFGQPMLIPWTLILVNLIAIGLGTWFTEQLLLDLKVSRWYALTYGLYGGQFLTLRTDMNEPLAQMLIQGAMLAWVKERHWWAVVAFALAALTKETSLIFLGAYIISGCGQGCLRSTTASSQWWMLGLAIVPYGIYQILLWSWLGRPGIGSGGAGATSFSLIPLAGWLEIAQISLLAFLLISLIILPMSILPAVAGMVMSLRRVWQGNWHPYVVSLLLSSVVLLYLPMSTFREPAAMIRLTQGLVVAMMLYGGLIQSHRILRYCTLWIFTGALLVHGVA